MRAQILDLACEHEHCCYISTNNYVVVFNDKGVTLTPSPTGALGITISIGLVPVHHHGIYRLLPLLEEITAMPLSGAACVTSIGEFVTTNRAHLISSTPQDLSSDLQDDDGCLWI